MRECIFFFFNDTATTEIYTLSLHDALPICSSRLSRVNGDPGAGDAPAGGVRLANGRRARRGAGGASTVAAGTDRGDRKSTRLNSSHANISYAVFCLKKKN